MGTSVWALMCGLDAAGRHAAVDHEQLGEHVAGIVVWARTILHRLALPLPLEWTRAHDVVNAR